MTQKNFHFIRIVTVIVCACALGTEKKIHAGQLPGKLLVPTAIYHAFDMKFEDIIKQLSVISDSGFTHIQLSPCQKSRTTLPHTTLEATKNDLIKKFGSVEKIPSNYLDHHGNPIKDAQGKELGNVWWLAYQPISYEIGGQYGSEADLVRLIAEAKKYKLNIIADVVFNHVAGLGGVEEQEWRNAIDNKKKGDSTSYDSYMKRILERNPAFNLEDFNPFKTSKYDYDGKLEGIWLSGALPSLNLRSKRVKKAQNTYLKKLINLGIEGFRFDAIKYFPPDAWKAFSDFLKNQHKFIYGELVDTWANASSPNPYTPYTVNAPATDFVLLNTLIKTFTYGGDLRSLRIPRTNGDPQSITFAENHDTKERQIRLFISDPIDRKLATLFILARHDGVPLILADEYREFPELATGLRFRNLMKKNNAPMEYVVDSGTVASLDSKEVMIMLRGTDGFMILNKSADNFESTLNFGNTDFNLNGKYTNIGEKIPETVITIIDNKIKVTIPSRNALFFVKNVTDEPTPKTPRLLRQMSKK